MKSYHNNSKITSLSDKSQIRINEITMYGQERRRDELVASIRANGGASVDDRVKGLHPIFGGYCDQFRTT